MTIHGGICGAAQSVNTNTGLSITCDHEGDILCLSDALKPVNNHI